MSAVWTGSFGVLEVSGFQDSPRPNVIKSPADIGEGKWRRRYTGKLRTLRGSKTWTTAIFNTFITWFQEDIAEGAVEFTMTDPIIGDSGTFRLGTYESEAISGGLVRVTLEMIRVS